MIKMLQRNFKCLCGVIKRNNLNNVVRNFKTDFRNNRELIDYYMKTFDLPEYRVLSVMLKYPTLQNSDLTQLDNTLNTFLKLGVTKDELIKDPRVLNVHSITIANRWNILKECKSNKITLNEIHKFKSIHRKYSVSQLYKKQVLLEERDLWSDLVESFDYWPDIQHKLVTERINVDTEKTLREVRMEVLKKFLILHLNYTNSHFLHVINVYTAVKNKSFTSIKQVIHVLEQMKFPKATLAAYGYILLLDPENIAKIMTEVKELGGLKVEEVMQKYPAIMKNNYKDLLQIKQFLKEAGISDDIQQKCFLLYTLCADTVIERLNKLKEKKDFEGFEVHPRIMSFLYNNTKVLKRIDQLRNINKKCFSLHKLTAGQKEFDRFLNNFGDQTKGLDTLHFLTKKFSPMFSKSDFKKTIAKHPFWLYVPPKDVIESMNYFEQIYSKEDIFSNSQLLLYPLLDAKKILEYLQDMKNGKPTHLHDELTKEFHYEISLINVSQLTDNQLLSLTLYYLEKCHLFSGNGIWLPKHQSSEIALLH